MSLGLTGLKSPRYWQLLRVDTWTSNYGIKSGRTGRDRREEAEQIQESIPSPGREHLPERPGQSRFIEGG